MENMLRIQLLIENKIFNECLQKTNEYEKSREFCKHGTEHLLNVARIAMLLNYEEKLYLDQEVIYATALLHDIGRYVQNCQRSRRTKTNQWQTGNVRAVD